MCFFRIPLPRLSLQILSLHVRGHQDDKRDYDDLTRPEQLNILANHRATVKLQDPREAGQHTEFYPLPAYLRNAIGYITSREQRTLRSEFPEYELQAYLQKRNDWSDSMPPSISLHTDQPLLYSLIASGPSWSNLVMAGYALAYAKDDAALRLISVRNATKSRPFVPLPGQCILASSVSDPPPRDWFLTGDTKDPDSNDPILQSGWFQVLKGLTGRG
jgi:hypothetical protein